MSVQSGNEIIPVMPDMDGATMAGNSEKSAAPAAEVDYEVCNVKETIHASAILVNWIVAAYKKQFPDGWDVCHFETMF